MHCSTACVVAFAWQIWHCRADDGAFWRQPFKAIQSAIATGELILFIQIPCCVKGSNLDGLITVNGDYLEGVNTCIRTAMETLLLIVGAEGTWSLHVCFFQDHYLQPRPGSLTIGPAPGSNFGPPLTTGMQLWPSLSSDHWYMPLLKFLPSRQSQVPIASQLKLTFQLSVSIQFCSSPKPILLSS